MWLQEVDSISSGNSKLLMIFIGIVAISLLIQALVVVALGVIAAKVRTRLMQIVEEIRPKAINAIEKATPLIESTANIVRDAQPKVKVVTDNLVEVSHVVRAKAQELDVTISDVNQKTRAQATRVDGMVTSVLTSTSDIAAKIEHGIKVPVREVSGIVNGLKAGLDVLMGRTKGFGRHSSRAHSDGYGDDEVSI